MIIPEPKGLPPRALKEGRDLTTRVQSLESGISKSAESSRSKLQQSNISLQALSQQVETLQQIVNAIPSATSVFVQSNNSFTVSASSYTLMVTNTVPVPTGYSKATVMAFTYGVLTDPTIPYFLKADIRIAINGVYTLPIQSDAAYYGSPPRNVFQMGFYREVSGVSSITISVEALADQTIQSDSSTFCSLCAIIIYS